MILYVNGNEHCIAAYATDTHVWGDEDQNYFHIGPRAHPDNLKVSFISKLVTILKSRLVLAVERGRTSNTTILNDLKTFMLTDQSEEVFYLIGWNKWDAKNDKALIKEVQQLHKDMLEKGIKHLFFNVENALPKAKFNWAHNYIHPYDQANTFVTWNEAIGFARVHNEFYGVDAHAAWARYILQYLTQLI